MSARVLDIADIVRDGDFSLIEKPFAHKYAGLRFVGPIMNVDRPMHPGLEPRYPLDLCKALRIELERDN